MMRQLWKRRVLISGKMLHMVASHRLKYVQLGLLAFSKNVHTAVCQHAAVYERSRPRMISGVYFRAWLTATVSLSKSVERSVNLWARHCIQALRGIVSRWQRVVLQKSASRTCSMLGRATRAAAALLQKFILFTWKKYVAGIKVVAGLQV